MINFLLFILVIFSVYFIFGGWILISEKLFEYKHRKECKKMDKELDNIKSYKH